MSRHYVISDLHLGMGKLTDESWHPLEDFRSDAAFESFLHFLEDDGADELIINGDWLDFMQLEPYAYTPDLFSVDGHRLGWTEEESLQKLENCRKAHAGFFSNLRSFIASNNNRKVTVIMGNHDPDLFWPKVQKQMRDILGSPSEKNLEFSQTSVQRGSAHIEHGHQYCSPENKFYNASNVFHECAADGLQRLEMVWGTIFVMEFFNKIEETYPFADNVKTQMRALFLGIRNRWVTGRMAAKFVKFLWNAGIPWSSITANVLSSQTKSPHKLIQDINDRDLAYDLLKIYDSDPAFKQEFDAEIAETPSQDWQGINAPRPQQPVSLDQLTPNVASESATLGAFRDEPEFLGARELMKRLGVKHVIFGHTHMEIDGNAENAVVPNYFNTGCWVGSIDLAKKENRIRLTNLQPEDLKDDGLFELRFKTTLVELDGEKTSVRLEPITV